MLQHIFHGDNEYNAADATDIQYLVVSTSADRDPLRSLEAHLSIFRIGRSIPCQPDSKPEAQIAPVPIEPEIACKMRHTTVAPLLSRVEYCGP
jgi:hypothetical protein